LIRQSVQTAFRQHFPATDFKSVIEWFETGGNLKLGDVEPPKALLARLERVSGLFDRTDSFAPGAPEGLRASIAEFILEGLHSLDKIGRSEERGFTANERKATQELYRDYSMERNRYKKPLN
jgi:magnesium chelatase subunit I